ncbi:UDP-N-acetylglucosamine 2-epimerase (non-hydrolyzing) [Vagococcus martis]|uniref:UDP-N-acetylglucosamine 2-epimerase (non-hydrolyzing) n=1 Tax=Vagococcus martis TaxID=1768210 RepID=A0A1V4DKR2_9ENTE|nr:UDP-N-acetylglucosamine 2-epimerase (non-hydrolyzing) [Vagococcus martis]OPF88870.1 UDP-N-acetylglucosamine 2-epimerase (non-hydrolyzing) [Vagococcus martis]
MLVFGTRPEAIKMCPLVNELEKQDDFETVVCVTGQHREMLDQVLSVFNVVPKYDLDIMKSQQDLFDVTKNILEKIKPILIKEKPDMVLVHGDTSTSYASALAAFYLKIPVGHVEAGLRTHNISSPFPEEFNRQSISLMSSLDFAPTNQAKETLLNEGKKEDTVFVTGNTAIDALKTTVKNEYISDILEWVGDSRLIVLTAHRRENQGKPMKEMFQAVKRVVDKHEDVKVVYPIHMNPSIQILAKEVFGQTNRVKLIPPMDVIDFHNLLAKSYLIITDSGGIQEEAPSLGKPVLVMRDTTERPEGIKAGTLKLVGTKEDIIYEALDNLLTNEATYLEMSTASNPYGDGTASQQIATILKNKL